MWLYYYIYYTPRTLISFQPSWQNKAEQSLLILIIFMLQTRTRVPATFPNVRLFNKEKKQVWKRVEVYNMEGFFGTLDNRLWQHIYSRLDNTKQEYTDVHLYNTRTIFMLELYGIFHYILYNILICRWLLKDCSPRLHIFIIYCTRKCIGLFGV